MERLSNLLRADRYSTTGFLLCLGFLFLVTASFHARPVPFGNEFIYLMRLAPYAPANDWSFAHAADEHWLFNFIFSIPQSSSRSKSWAGPDGSLVWILCLTGLIRLGQNWEGPILVDRLCGLVLVGHRPGRRQCGVDDRQL
ncbi:MAG: hypothetical protein IPM59_00090 [Chloracidobacterium sp.]|nr:hypothetical protein [Chloracidobacterium sp.]